MSHKGDLSMGNKTSEELVGLFLDDLQQFLQDSNPNLGRKSSKRDKFIATIMGKVGRFVCGPERDQEETPANQQSKSKTKQVEAMKDRVLCMEPNEQIRKATNRKGGASMTEEASMQADIELGNPHNMIKEE
ncbi:hypothetical protein LCGC14_1921850 [marine sediment metagenome]|uniref:Uncharacterized protein n=1 Tax=marine sediment metagenome TaxID=412755 RepID=A0A0F9GDY4_9ZZZZ